MRSRSGPVRDPHRPSENRTKEGLVELERTDGLPQVVHEPDLWFGTGTPSFEVVPVQLA